LINPPFPASGKNRNMLNYPGLNKETPRFLIKKHLVPVDP
jgi:hypothetical protein